MSTKIYQAFRVDAARINDVIDWARDQMESDAMVWLDRLIEYMEVDVVDPPDHITHDPEGVKIWYRAKKLDIVWAKVEEDAKSAYKNLLDFTCGINVWFYDAHIYIIPIGPNYLTKGLNENKPEWVQDYRYWNNTDHDEDVTYEEWCERGETWDAICGGQGRADHNARRLYHEVIDPTNSTGFDFKWRAGTGALMMFQPKKLTNPNTQGT